MPMPGDTGLGRGATAERTGSRGKSAPGRTGAPHTARVADGGQSWLPPLTPAVGERTMKPELAAAEQEKQNRLMFTKPLDVPTQFNLHQTSHAKKAPVKLPALAGTTAAPRVSGSKRENALSDQTGRGHSETSKVPRVSSSNAHADGRDMGADVRTGAEVVEFYSHHGHSSSVKFFYCLPAKSGLKFRPYDLVVVSREEAGATQDYFTMSASGVVRIQNGEHSEFTPLGEWMRERSLFSTLTRIKFFKHYLVYKSFSIWRKSVRAKLFAQVRARIERRLFLAKPTFCPSLLELAGFVAELGEVKLLAGVTGHLYTLEEFADLQHQHRQMKAVPALERAVERAQAVLERVCKEVSRQAKLYKESVRDEAELNDTIGVNLYAQTSAERARSMVAIKEEKMERARTYRRVAEELSMLGAFVRLADYMVCEALFSKAVSTAEEAYQLLQAPRAAAATISAAAAKGAFATALMFGDSGTTVFTPTEEDFLNLMNHVVLEGALTCVQGVPRLLLMRAFSQFFDGKVTGLNPSAIIRNEPHYVDLRSMIESLIRNDFAEARQYAQTFMEYYKIYTYGKEWDGDAYARNKRGIKAYKQDLIQQREWRFELDRMKLGNALGVLQIDSKGLKNSLLPVTQKALEVIRQQLLSATREETTTALASLKARLAELSDKPSSLKDYVAFAKTHAAQAAAKKEVQIMVAAVEEMYDILTNHEVKIQTPDLVKLDDLREAFAQFSDTLESGKTLLDEHRAGMMQDLDKSVADLNEECIALLGSLHGGGFSEPESSSQDMVQQLSALMESVGAIRARSQEYREYFALFSRPPDEFANLQLVEKELSARDAIWRTLHEFELSVESWMQGPVANLSLAAIQAEVDRVGQEAFKLARANKDDRVVFRLKDLLEGFKLNMPLVEELANSALRTRHWQSIFTLLGAEYVAGQPFSISDLQGASIDKHIEAVSRIGSAAAKEASLEKALEKMEADWQGIEFRVNPYKDTGTYILGGVDEVQLLLDDQAVKIQSMRASPFIKPFEERASDWDGMLSTLQEMLDNWLTCQSTWQYLEPIFSSEDIIKQLPEEGGKFQNVDGLWRNVMDRTARTPAALAVARDRRRLEELIEANELLDAIQKGLASYLEVKRIAFPRFFFLSNDEMLEILSETKDPTRVQPHLKKCFEGINALDFKGRDATIKALVSAEGELVPLVQEIKPAKAKGAVEKWLLEVESGMVESVHAACTNGVNTYPTLPREEWVLQHPGQVVLVVTGIFWTKEVTEGMLEEQGGKPGCVKGVAQRCTEQLSALVGMVRGNLSKLDRATLSALVVMDVHARDTVDQLAADGVNLVTDFSWLSQLRMYYEEDTVPVRMMNASVEYGYEYLGNSSRLVITPLTDRCYRTLIGAIHLNMGGAPEGPAGTGKTETTKDLAKALARQCVVFNCSDSLDYLTMAKFFKGLASSGAWACFDEFNRINLEVLSVVAGQVLEIQLAVKNKVKTFVFEGSELKLRPTCNAFITMNPGYAGRSELPDNLKALFRTVAMMVPDYAMISEIILYSNGYLNARDCARKIVATYKLCSEQLSSQDWYDYGMRAVMAVLRAAGNLKRKMADADEAVLTLRAIIDVNLCKFTSFDVPLFQGIVSDLFPGVVLPEPDYVNLTTALKAQCVDRNLQATPYFLEKVIQLYEMVVVRHGLMVVGLPFSGKTCAINVLAGALSDLKSKGLNGEEAVEVRVLNPKSVTMGQLYGETDKATQEWKDGVLAVQFRSLASDPSPDRKWLVLDGPVDAIWIENMNTVLDDNKKLCLPNSEIVQMSPQMTMMFEVADLAVASPATVSRCGMVYIEPHQLGWRPLLTSWAAVLPALLAPHADRICQLTDWLLPPLMRFVRRTLSEISPTSDANLAVAHMRMILSLTARWAEEAGEGSKAQLDTAAIDAIVLFSCIWSVGGTTDSEGREHFSQALKDLLIGGKPHGVEDSYFTKPVTLQCDPMPMELDVFDYMLIVKPGEPTRWMLWTDSITEEQRLIPPGTSFSQIIVPTADSARYTFLVDLAVKQGYPALLVGPTGTGKSVYVNRYLMNLPKDKYTPVGISMSARTNANQTQEQVDGRLDKRRKGVYGPPPGRKAVIFVDDLNMPTLEVYGAQPPIELLRQFMDYGGWYGRDNTFRELADVQFLAAMGPAGGGRNPVTSRYLRHFNLVSVAQVANKTLASIFKTMLDWHVSTGGFSKEVAAISEGVINATLDIYTSSMEKLLPTPAKSHYTFNLRDFARVMQGIMLQPADALEPGKEGAAAHVRLWCHEVFRVFYDRLVDRKDQEWLLETIKQCTKKHFDSDFNALFKHLDAGEKGNVDVQDVRSCIFGDYMDPSIRGDETAERQPYMEIRDTDRLIGVLEEYLTEHNGLSKRPMNLAMFLFAAEHISRICRVLRQPRGHLLLAGVGGSGRQSLSRLAAFMSEMEVFQIEVTKNYTIPDWREDLKKMLRKAGGDGKQCVFLFSDTQIKDEVFVEDINNILNSGEVPNMFPMDEKMGIIELVRVAAAKSGRILESQLELWSYFTERCRDNLHVVLCLSPIGNAFRERLRQFPSLVNCCTIDWFQEWPDDALEAVAAKFLGGVELQRGQSQKLTVLCKSFHSSARDASLRFRSQLGRHNYVTPTSYLELLTLFQTLLAQKRAETLKTRSRYAVGLEKLMSSAEQVAGMQRDLEALKPQLIKTVAEVEELMKKIEREKAEVVEPKKAIVQKDEEVASRAAAAAGAIKRDCEAELAKALPILRDALAALDTLKPADIQYVKQLKNPPATVKLVMEAVCVILDVKPGKAKDESGKDVPDFWGPSLKLLNEKDFLDRLRNYDKDNIPPRIMKAIRDKYISNENFTPEKAANASSAAEGLCKWVCAMDKYDDVAKVVEPKRAKLAEAEAEYSVISGELKAKQGELQALVDKLSAMENELKANTVKKEQLEHEVDMCTVKLERAEKLIGGLGGERARWTEIEKQMGDAYGLLTGDMLLAAGLIGYLGAFTAGYRTEIVEQWVELITKSGIPRSPVFSLNSALGNPVKVREWLISGLPNDSFSIDNGIIVANSRRWPLMIDPQGQANKWIKNMERSNNLQTVKLSESGEHMRTLENAIQFGLPVLLENVGEELDPSLEPLLLKQTFKSGGVLCIRLGDANVEYSQDFRFYITTKLRNPHYLPETSVKVTLLNFMITPEGLSDQLLGVVVAKERPDLEEEKNALVVQGAENKRKLTEIETRILEVLSNSEGNILDDETAIATISDAKVLSNEVSEKQKVAEETERQIDAARKGYKPCGDYTAVLFFAIADLANIEPMYQYSLVWFVNLFVASIAASAKSDDVAQRLDHIQDHFTYALYCNVCRSLFEKDKLLFAFLLCSRILGAKGEIDPQEWMFLLTGGLGSGVQASHPADAHWVSNAMWADLRRLSALPAFAGLVESFQNGGAAAWLPIYAAAEPHKVPVPAQFSKLTGMQKVLLVRCLRPDKVVPAVQEFVGERLGEKYVLPPRLDLKACYADSAPTTPLIFVLSAGSDPMAMLLQFAGECDMASRVAAISLGQGQGPKAAALIRDGAKSGTWVVLQNCHLAPSWMPALERICEELDPEGTSADFRLWMTSYPSPTFPVTVLQNGIKMTNEPPKGLRANISRSLTLDPINTTEFFEGSSKPREFKSLLMGLLFFHAVVQERRKFGPLGFNIPYGFDDGDCLISVRQLRMFIDENEVVPLAALRYVTGECNYGGRVTDDKDRILLNCILGRVYRPDTFNVDSCTLSASGLYYIPPPGPLESYVDYVNKLPIIPMPEAFGLHDNADIAKDLSDTQLLCQSLLTMTGSGGGGGGESGGGAAAGAQMVNESLKNLPPNFDIEAAQLKWPVKYEDSFNTVLTQEMSRYNKLLDVIRSSLSTISRALQGLVVMNAEMDTAYRSIAINAVPELWKRASYPSLKPVASYMEDLSRRCEMLRSWCDNGPPPVFWVSGFFFVQSFLTASMQNYARRNKIPIDEVAFQHQCLGLDKAAYAQPPETGVYLEGLFLEGAGWDAEKRMLCEQEPKVLTVSAPVIWLKPMRASEVEAGQTHNCPLYRTGDRRGVLATTGHSTNFVMFVRLPTDKPTEHWTLRGVAMLTQTSE